MTKAETSRGNLNPIQARGRAVRSMIACASACLVAGLALALAPLAAHAQSANPPCWSRLRLLTDCLVLDFCLAVIRLAIRFNPGSPWSRPSQAAQPSWMTPLVTVTPRLEQEFRWDFYDQQNGSATNGQGNGQHLINYGGPGGARVEFIPAYNWEVILAPPPYVTATGPKGSAEGWGDWPAFLVKYRIASANAAERRLYRNRLLSGCPIRSARRLKSQTMF